ncbi:ATP-dependent helicase [Pseudofrankia inefficax]|uniref:DNA 3'-5' helicase n=1 Tax=Pseudofrankia inefficax (strain DSM 45817 / CECT 9037 / DDB 130130 / EuI1c) TaxID=298654 RepID=E3IUV4_PSEI1|nr:ATP-dependent DNA helicase [Pseudofrankia inefficax]ADP78834.1 UvrD/REP helicase [Pseudofrankia inefficax]
MTSSPSAVQPARPVVLTRPVAGARAPRYRLDRSAPARWPGRPAALDDAQRAVVEHRGGPLLVLAGPGTGKTTTLVEAVARRVEAGQELGSILVLTFSRRAARELSERITARVGAAFGGPVAWTFHSWCYAQLRAYPMAGDPAPRLLTGPERFTRLRELIDGSRELGRPGWPAPLEVCLRTRGFAEEVEALLARVREVGLDPASLEELAARARRPDWAALARFYTDYLDNLGYDGALDYPELGHRAARLVEDPERGQPIRDRYRAVFVDEYQDTDPAQERLLAALTAGGGDLVAFGDPDQSIYAFRGARVRGLLDFPARFRRADRSPADVLALGVSRRMSPPVLAASREVASRLPVSGLPVWALRAHRRLAPAEPDHAGEVEALSFPSEGAETEAIADLLRREHLTRAVPWHEMAVLTRSAEALPAVARALTAAGVPVDLAGDEPPLAERPAAALLLTALRCADDPGSLTTADARSLLLSPLGGADPAGLRALGRALRDHARSAPGEAVAAADGADSDQAPGSSVGWPAGLVSSAELIRDLVADPGSLPGPVPAELARPAVQVGSLLALVGRRLRAGVTPQDALWALWEGTAWPARLRRVSASGYGAARRAAEADLDAVVALFDAAGRLGERRGPGGGAQGLIADLTSQDFAADDRAGAEVRPDAVRLLTAHRAKGLEWDVVVIRGVQDGAWPDLRAQHSLLGTEQLDAPQRGGLRPPETPRDRWAEERRLFYVAVTRARHRLVVTAVDAVGADGARRSELLAELGVRITSGASWTPRPLTLPSLVATLRRLAADPGATPALRQAARRRLATLAAVTDHADRPLVLSAHPDRWWGARDETASDVPVAAPTAPIPLSGSSLSSLRDCSLRWFLEHEAHAGQPATTAQSFGRVVHALADEVTAGRTPADLAALDARLDLVWRQLAFEAQWRSDQERTAARQALARFLDWHAAERGRAVLGSEARFGIDLTVDGRPVRLRGSMDRIELDDGGQVHVVDFKTGRSAVSPREIAEHVQLGTYQLAVREGAVDDRVTTRDAPSPETTPQPEEAGESAVPGGAELVYLRREANEDRAGPGAPGGPTGLPQVQRQDALPPGRSWIDELVGDAVRTITTEAFVPTPGPGCDYCSFRRACPAFVEGRQVVT